MSETRCSILNLAVYAGSVSVFFVFSLLEFFNFFMGEFSSFMLILLDVTRTTQEWFTTKLNSIRAHIFENNHFLRPSTFPQYFHPKSNSLGAVMQTPQHRAECGPKGGLTEIARSRVGRNTMSTITLTLMH